VRFLAYMVAALSCGVLAALYWRQANTLAAALAAAACVFFLARLFFTRKPATTRPPAGPGNREQARRDLEEMLPPLRRNRAIMRAAFVALVVAGVVTATSNLPLGLAFLAFSPVAGWLFHRNHQAVRMIEQGLGLQ